MDNELPELIYYYPEWIWRDSDWVKNLILFFDGVTLLVPNYMLDRPHMFDPAIIAGLQEHGLLKILEPETVIDKKATETLATGMTDIIASGVLDDWGKKYTYTRFHELSRSRLGFHGDPGFALMIYEELKTRGLAKPSEDGVSIPLHPMVRSLVLVLLAQIICAAGKGKGLILNPATDNPEMQRAFTELLDSPRTPSAGHVVSMDLQTVGVDLSDIPIDEVLGFRTDHYDEYRKYSGNLKKFIREISQFPSEIQAEALRNRQAEIRESANHLQQLARRAWRRRLSFSLGIAGAGWTVAGGDPIGGVLAMAAGFAGATAAGPTEISAFSYLFNAKGQLG